ncbi:MAG: hypothetical protein KJT03_05140 [Verrucomicrobiae bacterium]|nr:hypothetical protein [Verrucomicrobiae bacterium]
MNLQSGFIAFLNQRTSGKRCVVLFILTSAVYLLMLLVTIPSVQQYAPDIPLFDMSPSGYDYGQAMSLLKLLGEEGRSAYRFPQLAVDLVYPGLFAVTYAMILTWAFRKRVRLRSKIFYVTILPVTAGLFDYAENILIFLMLSVYPHVAKGLVAASSIFTILKSVFTTLSLLLVLLALALLLKRTKAPA